jgi:GNAT superfamily N-acetyltransferase
MDLHVRITEGSNDDFIRLVRLLDEECLEMIGNDKAQHKQFKQVKDDSTTVVVVYDGMTPIACGSFRNYSDDTVEMKRVFVRKVYRNKGLASKVMHNLEKLALAQGHAYAILETNAKIQATVDLYKHLQYDTIHNYGQYEKDMNCICMKKILK